MPFLLLLFLTIACLPPHWDKPWDWLTSPWQSAALTAAGVVAVIGFAAGLTRRVRRLCREPGGREHALRRYGSWRFYHLAAVLLTYMIALYVFGWGWAVQSFFSWGEQLAPGAELLILSPFLASLVLSWACFYGAERALHGNDASRPTWGRWAYVGFHVRQNLVLVCVPLLVLMIEKGIRAVLPDGDESWQTEVSLLCLAAVLAVLVSMPWLIRLVLGLKPLPDGPLRDRLEAASRRLRFRCSDILLWNTRGGVANAMVAGLLPYLRYVVLTDRLANDLTPDEVEAVFGHEVGHVKHHHMLYYFGFLVVSMLAVYAVVAVFFPGLDAFLQENLRKDLAMVPAVAALGTYIFLVFGFVSRRCERQADIYGCRAVSCRLKGCDGHGEGAALAPAGTGLCPTGIRTFINALEKVARLNGISRDRPGWLQSWQHSTIARRVDFLQAVLADPSVEPRFQRTVLFVKCVMLLGLAGLVLYLGMAHGWKSVQL